VLQFLVTSKARRRLLQLLWGEEARGSASELADEAGVAFATAHAELKAMRQFGLVRVERDGRRDVYVANFEHPDGEALKTLLRGSTSGWAPSKENDDDVRGWLRAVGLPLRVPEAKAPAPSLSEVLVEGVRLARRDPTVARALPLGFWKQRGQLDADDLLEHVSRPEEKHALGFFLELTGQLGGDRRLKALAKKFKDKRLTAERDFFLLPPTASRRKLAESRTPAVAKRWGFRMNMDTEAFASLFEKFGNQMP
jgi:hypothetical protein